MSERKVIPGETNEQGFPLYPKWVHIVENGKVVKSLLVKNKDEEDAFYGVKKEEETKNANVSWGKKK